MLRNLSIAKRLYLGFGIIMLGTLVAFISTFFTISESKKVDDKINNEINPAIVSLNDLQSLLQDLKTYTFNWYNAIGPNDNNNRNKKINKIIKADYPILKRRLLNQSLQWNKQQLDLLTEIVKVSDSLVKLSNVIVEEFRVIADYEDSFKSMQYSLWFESSGEIGGQNVIVFEKLRALMSLKKREAEQGTVIITKSFNSLVRLILFIAAALAIGGLFISFFTIRSIVIPVDKLKSSINTMSLGVVPKEKIVLARDEIGQMSSALDNLIRGFERTTVFANEIGQGKFETDYNPLSKDDTLGKALMYMRDEIKESRRDLEVKVEERTLELKTRTNEIEYLYGQVTDSIKYAKKLQEAILPTKEIVNKLLPDAFILYHPKDIVSGDFYWVEEKNTKTYFAAVDCTGHGVPGAFMSIVGRNLLKQILADIKNPQPNEILNELSKGIAETLHTKDSYSKDGMDIALCSLDYASMTLEFSGAINELYLVRDGVLQIIIGDKTYIGTIDEAFISYSNNLVNLQKNDCLYIFTDGFRDQFGGIKGKKFMRKRFDEMILSHHTLEMKEQRRLYTKTFRSWMGMEEQVDDVLMIGVRV
jgi:serine phosphatase RsbU (regulator of sigma subunit)/HAMP domain-containing protein